MWPLHVSLNGPGKSVKQKMTVVSVLEIPTGREGIGIDTVILNSATGIPPASAAGGGSVATRGSRVVTGSLRLPSEGLHCDEKP